MTIDIETYEKERDLESVLRIWEEVGWLDRSSKKKLEAVEVFFDACRGTVARIDGESECSVFCADGNLQYLDEKISLGGVMGVTTSHVARKQGLAGRMTAQGIAESRRLGASLSALGIFEQGFYDRLGFGSMGYVNQVRIDPQSLLVPFPTRSPKRLSQADWETMHGARLGRLRGHGSVSFDSPAFTRYDQADTTRGFGLGFHDAPDGGLSHHVWFRVEDMEHGPYHAVWMSYRNYDQFMELMGVIRGLGDQVRMVVMHEPAAIQLQDLVKQPMQLGMVTRKSKFQTGTRSLSWQQLRINDVAACLAKTHLPGAELRFNLVLRDPIEGFLPEDAEWRGESGEYVVTLGAESGAEPARDASLPTLTASVNAFTRMWLGVLPASGLAATDSLEAEPALLEALDAAFRLPKPQFDWDF